MLCMAGTLAAPFPYFGGKSGACQQVWGALGNPVNYVEPFAGSAAMLLGRPEPGKVETINDADGFVANFWRAISQDAAAVARIADWPTNEVDLFARHSWLVRGYPELLDRLEADPDFCDAKIAAWWCWGACNWIGSGWCSGTGPWIHDGNSIVKSEQGNGQGINRQIPHLGNAGQGINRQIPHLSAGRGSRSELIMEWFETLSTRMRNVRVAAGDWRRVLTDSVTVRHGITGIFLDPPYTKGKMDYAAGGVGGKLAEDVRSWCLANGSNSMFRIVLCGHVGEHDELLSEQWNTRTWTAKKGYALTDEAMSNSADETIWCSPYCEPERHLQEALF